MTDDDRPTPDPIAELEAELEMVASRPLTERVAWLEAAHRRISEELAALEDQ